MLTSQQIQEARNKLGTNTVVGQNTGNSLLSVLQEREPGIKRDVIETAQSIKEGVKGRAENIRESVTSLRTGEQGLQRTAGQVAGQIAGGVSDVAGEAVIGAGKAILPQGAQEAIGGAVQDVAGKVIATEPIQELMQRYENLKQNDPAKARDVDALLGLGSLIGDVAGFSVAGKGSKVAAKGAKQAGTAVVEGTQAAGRQVAKVAGEVIPSPERVVNYQVTRALDLTQGDVKNIAQSTGNEVGEFLAKKNLIGTNKDETLKVVSDFYQNQYKTVRDEIGKVKKTYSKVEVPRMGDALTQIKKQVDGIVGLEDVSKEVDTLLKKDKVALADVQRVKELLDEHFNLYKVTGDVKEGVQKEGLANLRTQLKEFIENEVSVNTGADIRVLNNDVATSRSIMDAIEERATRGLTTSNIKLGDLGVFGVGSALGSPLLGAAAVFGKKVLESSAIRLKIARYLDKVSDARKAKLRKALEQGEVPKELSAIVGEKKSGKGKVV